MSKAAAADLEDIRRSACATDWQNMLTKRRAPQVLERAAGDRLVEGEPMVIQVADSGSLLHNTLRKTGKTRTRNVRDQAIVCAGMYQTMTRPVVLAFQHTFLDKEGFKFDLTTD